MQDKVQGFQGFELLDWKNAKAKLKASSTEAQKQFGRFMEQAGSMFQASCEELQWKFEEACGEPDRSLKET